MNIIWKTTGGYKTGFATTKSGLKACIVEVQRSTSETRQSTIALIF